MNFAELISKRRKELHLSLYAVSDLSGLNPTTIMAYEKGTQPTILKADQLLKALGLSLQIGKASNYD